MKTKFLFGMAIVLVALASPASATSVAANLPSDSYSASSLASNSGAAAAFNGANWNAGNYGTQWVQVDLGKNYAINGVSLITDQLPDDVTWQQIYVSDTAIGGSWVDLTAVAGHTGYTATGTLLTFDFSAITGRYVEIVANGGASWTALGQITVSAVPEPSTYAMLLGGLAMLVWGVRRRRGSPENF